MSERRQTVMWLLVAVAALLVFGVAVHREYESVQRRGATTVASRPSEGDALFRAKGCVPAIACGSVLTEMIAGRTLSEARGVRRIELVMKLGGLPTASLHASHLAIDVLAKALSQVPGRQ